MSGNNNKENIEKNKEENKNSNNEKNFVGLKLTYGRRNLFFRLLINEKIYYIFFYFFSLFIVSLPFIHCIKFPHTILPGVATGTGIVFISVVIEFGNIIISAIICILCLAIYIILIKLKKFHSFLFFIPFSIIFFLNHSAVCYLYSRYYIYPHHFNLNSLLFFIQLHFIYFSFSYIPFIILLSIITILIYIKHLISTNRRVPK